MHAYDKCGLVWEREIALDHIQWGWCTRERGHHGPHGHASEIETTTASTTPKSENGSDEQ